jgi:hypothetical protein
LPVLTAAGLEGSAETAGDIDGAGVGTAFETTGAGPTGAGAEPPATVLRPGIWLGLAGAAGGRGGRLSIGFPG